MYLDKFIVSLKIKVVHLVILDQGDLRKFNLSETMI